MKFTLDWLKDHLETTASVEEIRRTLDQIGIEVERIDDPAAALANFTIARVVAALKHPNADKLQVLQVEIKKGSAAVEVVCGAPNARAGLVGVFAPLGAYIPGTGLTLEAKPVRGVVSNGMMLSEREMQLSDDHNGIVELTADLAGRIGEKYSDVMGIGDVVIEVKLTPNRPDCTGVRGIARDLAAAGLGTLKGEPRFETVVEGKDRCAIDIKLEFAPETAHACPVFAGRTVKSISNGASPQWMQQRLKAIGLRPINAAVDVTNYLTFDRGRPLHVYDLDTLKGHLRARMGRKGESFVALNGKTYAVDDSMCVIADDAELHLGGIMGGEHGGCTETTKNILIECAYFDPVTTATTGRKVGLTSDARYRFERGVDPAYVEPGLDLATAMILDFCGGTPSKKLVAGKAPIKPAFVDFNFDRVERLMGKKLPDNDIRRTLEALGFKIEGKGPTFKVAVPSWRPDVHGAADLVEEVARMHGLMSFPSAPLPRLGGVTKSTLTEGQRRVRRARRSLAARGFVEAITWSFIKDAEALHFGGGGAALELANPISSELSTMRPSVLPGLLAAAARNRNRGFADTALFEVGQAYRGDKPADQHMIAGGVRTGSAKLSGGGRHWSGQGNDVDVFDVKADVFSVLTALGFDPMKAQISRDVPAWYHPGKAVTLRLGPKSVLAHFGDLHPDTLTLMDVDGPAAAFEVFLDAVPAEKKKASKARPRLAALDLLPVTRDFAFILDQAVPASDVMRAAAGADKALIRDVSVFDLYEGSTVGVGKKSLAIQVTMQPKDHALTDEQIAAVTTKIVAEVTKATGGHLRG